MAGIAIRTEVEEEVKAGEEDRIFEVVRRELLESSPAEELDWDAMAKGGNRAIKLRLITCQLGYIGPLIGTTRERTAPRGVLRRRILEQRVLSRVKISQSKRSERKES